MSKKVVEPNHYPCKIKVIGLVIRFLQVDGNMRNQQSIFRSDMGESLSLHSGFFVLPVLLTGFF